MRAPQPLSQNLLLLSYDITAHFHSKLNVVVLDRSSADCLQSEHLTQRMLKWRKLTSESQEPVTHHTMRRKRSKLKECKQNTFDKKNVLQEKIVKCSYFKKNVCMWVDVNPLLKLQFGSPEIFLSQMQEPGEENLQNFSKKVSIHT